MLYATLAIYAIGWIAFVWAIASDRKSSGEGMGLIAIMALLWPMVLLHMTIHGAVRAADWIVGSLRRRPPN